MENMVLFFLLVVACLTASCSQSVRIVKVKSCKVWRFSVRNGRSRDMSVPKSSELSCLPFTPIPDSDGVLIVYEKYDMRKFDYSIIP